MLYNYVILVVQLLQKMNNMKIKIKMQYRAPELILLNKYYNYKIDIWSLGIIISELFLGTILFMEQSNKDQIKEIILKLGWPSKED